ncbi:phosphate-starvation-inducible protein PsiE [Thiothrix lacustris]|uniref:Protein PsiE n=1 Tax=Thiothrix lacustris TaxID=525917 RepID=A0ABY9MT12_9GAMM|nr:phosphate-starvation-inducible PsiE family protein [Thiothrix lacustris]WML91797.1 phosphate-starvation-inducible PsiE family protein [Thiothrix lacustris]WMP16368.1 phosphate-starvation-inducible PsiE family protein [Thiothrix lacustris]
MDKPNISASQKLLHGIEYLVLTIITIATVVAVGQEIANIITNLKVQIADLLLLFIYLEIITMVVVYLQSGEVPVRMPLYIGMVALARYLILDMKAMDQWQMLAISASILLISLAVLAVRFGHVKYPYEKNLKGKPHP